MSTALKIDSWLLPDGHTNAVYGVDFSHDGKLLASGGLDHRIKIWDATRRVLLRTIEEAHGDAVASLSFSPLGKQILTSGLDQTVKLWDAEAGSQSAVVTHGAYCTSSAFAPDGKQFASGGYDNLVKLWNANGSVASFAGHSQAVYAVAFSPDNRRLVSGSKDGTIRVWDHRRQKLVQQWTAHEGSVEALGFSPAAPSLLASCGGDGLVVLWKLSENEPGQVHARLRGHKSYVKTLACSLDGKRIASADRDGVIRIWDAVRLESIATWPGHRNTVYSLAFSPAGERLASASFDRTVRLWDISKLAK